MEEKGGKKRKIGNSERMRNRASKQEGSRQRVKYKRLRRASRLEMQRVEEKWKERKRGGRQVNRRRKEG